MVKDMHIEGRWHACISTYAAASLPASTSWASFLRRFHVAPLIIVHSLCANL